MNKFKLPNTRPFQNLRARMQRKNIEAATKTGWVSRIWMYCKEGVALRVQNLRAWMECKENSTLSSRFHELCAWLKCKARVKRGQKRTYRYADGALERATKPPHQNLDASKYGYSPSFLLKIWCGAQQFTKLIMPVQNLRAWMECKENSRNERAVFPTKLHGLWAWLKCKTRVKRGQKRTYRYADGALERATKPPHQNLDASKYGYSPSFLLKIWCGAQQFTKLLLTAQNIHAWTRGCSLRIWMYCKEGAKGAVRRTKQYVARALEHVTQQDAKSRVEHPALLGGRPVRCANSSGMILPTILIVMLITLTVALSLSAFVIAQLDRTTRGVMTANAMLAAEAGAEMTLHGLNEDQLFDGYPTEELFTEDDRGNTTYQTRVEEGDISNEKIITSTGRFYEPGNEEHTVQRSVQLVVVGTTTDDFSVQTGPGGLIMDNQATIANGDVHVNGYLQMRNYTRIGSPGNPSNVYVAHYNCPDPADEDFPRLCEPGEGEPIDIEGPAHIYGTVEANNQVSDDHMSQPGLVANAGVESLPLPSFDRPSVGEVISEEGQNVLASNASCMQNNGQATWLNNTRIINGDVEISHSCTVTIEGNVWVNQNLTMRNTGTLRVSDDVEEAPIIMIDGSSGIEMRNASRILTNSDGIGVRIITFYSEASCSPGCADGEVTGQDLFDSQDIVTVSLRNSSLAAGTSFYARWTKAHLNQSGAIGSVLGQTVQLSNTGNISFGEELSSGETVWAIKNYQQVFE